MKFALIVLSVLTLTFTIVTLDTWTVNQVLSLDGSRDYVEIPPSDSLDITGAVTLEGWMGVSQGCRDTRLVTGVAI